MSKENSFTTAQNNESNMTLDEIIQGLQFTVDMFLLDPNTGETLAEPRNDLDKTTIDSCKGAIEMLKRTFGAKPDTIFIERVKQGKIKLQKEKRLENEQYNEEHDLVAPTSYSRGVHDGFDGAMDIAFEILDAIINEGTTKPATFSTERAKQKMEPKYKYE